MYDTFSYRIIINYELKTCAMNGFVSKNDRKKIIIIISRCINEERKKKGFK
jgi:hypothetical protein